MTSTNDRDMLARIEAKLDALLGIPAPAAEPTPAEIRGLLASIDSARSQIMRGFDTIEAKLVEIVARDVDLAQRYRRISDDITTTKEI